MAITRGVGPAAGSVAGATTMTITLNSTTIGRMIAIVIGYNSATITSVNISGESDATRVTAADFSINGDSYAIFYLANNTAGGNKTITVNFSGSAYGTATAIEYQGQDTTTQPDATTASVTADQGISPPTGDPTISITTATAGDLIVAACSSNAGKPTVPSGYTTLSLTNPGYYGDAADNVAVGAAGSKTLIWADVFNSTWGANAVAFKAAGGAAAPTPNQNEAVTVAEVIAPNLINMPRVFN